jgi:hypothetical protein
MTEEEWDNLAGWCDTLEAAPKPINHRKMLLWLVSICRCSKCEGWEPELIPDLDVIERFSDGLASDVEFDAAVGRASYISYTSMGHDPLARVIDDLDNPLLCTEPITILDYAVEWLVAQADSPAQSLLRDIFGNPFRPVAFDPDWRRSTAVALAQGMYESRDFSAMPILADALQDAGCEDEAILTHCRDPKQVHVRGCWVVDLVLGKS